MSVLDCTLKRKKSGCPGSSLMALWSSTCPMTNFFWVLSHVDLGKTPCIYYEDTTKPPITGSTIRNWDKVKTWLDQMFWQIYQKLMLSGFLSSGNLCLIHHFKLFSPHRPQWPRSEKMPYLSEKLDFWWSIPQKITSVGYFGASDDQIIRIRKFFAGN